MFGSKLAMQLVPSSTHGRNLRKILKKESWSILSSAIRDRDRVCVHCEGSADHCHEVWEWVVSEGHVIQRLVGLEAVCRECHDFMHFGRLVAMGDDARQEVVVDHAIEVLTCDAEWLSTYIAACFVAHMNLSELPLVESMDLNWVYEAPASKLGLDAVVWSPIWSEIGDYMLGYEEEFHKERNAGILD